MIKIILVFVLSVAVISCGNIEYSDISEDASYASLINSKYSLLDELLIYGITLDRDYNNSIDYFTVMSLPGISGPEVLSEEALPVGTIFQIIRVERCSNCFPFPTKERLIVEILSSDKYKDILVEIDLDRLKINNTEIFSESKGSKQEYKQKKQG